MVRSRDEERRVRLLERCLAVAAEHGSLSLSIDAWAALAGTNKRMLIHYFGSREALERAIIGQLEERLREQFRAERSDRRDAPDPVLALWDQVTAPPMRGVLRLVMEVTQRAWSGDETAKSFLAVQQKAWTELLLRRYHDPDAVKCLLRLFQGAAIDYLVSQDAARGRQSLVWFLQHAIG